MEEFEKTERCEVFRLGDVGLYEQYLVVGANQVGADKNSSADLVSRQGVGTYPGLSCDGHQSLEDILGTV
ncbi:unnamed protein product [Echinostoma caproni]|uniref:Glutaredoxin domain-containing protein n=1 Tax=Echinostoma caproni TaxID=27848 RepID=A0A183BG44_9TREM|nr:unnamed protein product [Echinostoma caproni]